MKKQRVLSLFLAGLMLIGSLPLGVFATGTPAVNATPNYTEFRGSGMTADENGVMIYDDLEAYYKKSQKNVALSTEYGTMGAEADDIAQAKPEYYNECPYLYADYAIYFDESIEGTTLKVRYGLSMLDSIYYLDSATGEIVKGDKSPIELSAGYKNAAYPDYNAGFGLVYDGEKLSYTTRHYEKKNIIFYILNHRSSARIGQEDDVSILADYIAQGYVVVTLDFKASENTVTPYMEQALAQVHAMFDNSTADAALKDLGVTTDPYFQYYLPEGCRIERDIWFWDPSIWGLDGTMERFHEIWNTKISYEADHNQGLSNPKLFDTLGIGSVDSVEEMIAKVTKKDGTPIEYKLSMDIIYPSQPKDGYEAPLYIQEGTGETREGGVLTSYIRGSYTTFALNGYACVQYDHPFWPFLYRQEYGFHESGFNYGLIASSANTARAAVRCARYLSDALGYSDTLVGAAGISKATVGMAVLSVKNNKNVPEEKVTAFGVTYDNTVFEGDVFADGERSQSVIQPFMYYDDACRNEVSSECNVVYNSSGSGVQNMYRRFSDYEKVPVVLSSGVRDYGLSFDTWDVAIKWFDDNATEPFLPITQLDQGHAYPVGYDTEYGYHRFDGMLKFFNVFLKPEENKAPEVLWVTPTNGSTNVSLSGKWEIGPYTPYGWENDSHYHEQSIQIRFVTSVDPESVNEGVSVISESGTVLKGTWVASQQNALYTFVCDGLAAGTRYSIEITDGVKSAEGVALKEERTVSFKTEGTYRVDVVADTYVSSKAPDTVFGRAGQLKVSYADTTLITVSTENLLDAETLSLKAGGTIDAPLNVAVYALADYTVNEATLTYNILMASDAWANKAFVGEYAITDGNLSLDLSALAAMSDLGDSVTLAVVATDTLVGDEPYIFTRDFETPVIGTVVKEGTVTVLAEDGRVTDARPNYATINKPSSAFWWCRTGDSSEAYLVEESSISDSQMFRTKTKVTQGQMIKFFNALTDDYLTEDDIGKQFRISFDIYPVSMLNISVGMTPVVNGDGSAESPSSDPSSFYGDVYKTVVQDNQWTTVSCMITVTEDMVTDQAGLLTVLIPYWAEAEEYVGYTYFDNIVVEETTAPLFVDAREASGANGYMLIAENKGMALNAPITVTFPEAMELSTFVRGVLVRNEKTGKYVKGEWTSASEDNRTFAFVTGGLAADTTYTVSTNKKALTLAGEPCENEVIRTVSTEGSYALRPLVTSYVSIAAPTQHFGLDTEPILSEDKLGVVTFSAASLMSASDAKLYFDLGIETNSILNVYVLGDYKPDSSLCYNSLADKLTDTALLGSYKVADSAFALDVSSLAQKALGENVTLVFDLGYRFFNDFETPTVSEATALAAASSSVLSGNVFYSDKYIWSGAGGGSGEVHQMPAEGEDSQNLRVMTKHSRWVKFYNAMKGEAFDEKDIGRTYTVSMKMRTLESEAADVTKVNVQYGLSVRQSTEVDGVTVSFGEFSEQYGTKTLNFGDDWTTLSFDMTITEKTVNYQAGLLTLLIPYVGGTSGGTPIYTLIDDMLVEETFAEPIALSGLILVTENGEAVEITAEDNPVVDEEVELSSLVDLADLALNAPISVTFPVAMDASSLAEGVRVRNQKTGKLVKGEWSSASEDNKTFDFVTKGLEADTVYSVSTTKKALTLAGEPCENEEIYTVSTEGSYALRPLVTSYVSITAPTQHFGLDTEPILSEDKLGVVTFSAKTLKNASDAKLYFDLGIETNSILNVYVLGDYKPDGSLCYNSVADKLTADALLGSYKVADSAFALDVSSLAQKALGENVTLVFDLGYRFFNDFETPTVSEATSLPAASSSAFSGNVFYADGYVWSGAGASGSAEVHQMPAEGEDSQNLRVMTKHARWVKFYNAMKDEAFDEKDIGRTYRISMKLRTLESAAADVSNVKVQYGLTLRQSTEVEGVTVSFGEFSEQYGTQALSFGDDWTTLSFDIELTQKTVDYQAGLLTLFIPYVGGTSGGTPIYTLIDDMLVEETFAEPIALTGLMLVTENGEAVEITEEDNPVVDEELVIPFIDASLISYQVTTGEDGEFSVRLIAGLNSLEYKNYGYEVTVTTAEGTKTLSSASTRVYSSIYGGEILYSIKDTFGCEYAALATVTGLDIYSDYTEIEVRAYMVTREGETQYGRGATLLYTGVFDSEGYPEFSVEME